MIGILISELDPLVKDAIENTGCLEWLAVVGEDLTPVTVCIDPTKTERVKTKANTYFKTKTPEWKKELAEVLKQIYAELPELSFTAIVYDESDYFYIVVRAPGTDKTLFRHAKAKYVKTFQNPEIFNEEVI